MPLIWQMCLKQRPRFAERVQPWNRIRAYCVETLSRCWMSWHVVNVVQICTSVVFCQDFNQKLADHLHLVESFHFLTLLILGCAHKLRVCQMTVLWIRFAFPVCILFDVLSPEFHVEVAEDLHWQVFATLDSSIISGYGISFWGGRC